MAIRFGNGVVCLILVLCLAVPSFATVYTVGDAGGWNLGSGDASWPNGKTFKVGDSLVFNYLAGTHTVDEVIKSEYDSCTVAGKSISSDTSGNTTISLVAPGTRYFICTTTGHCGSGMKVAINVTGTPPTTPSPPPSVSSPPPTTPSTPPKASPPSATPSPSPAISPSGTVSPPTVGSPPEKDSAVAISPFVGAIMAAWGVAFFIM